MDSSKNDEKYPKIRYEPEKKITQSINRHGDFKFHGNFHAGLCHKFSKSSTLLYPTIAGKPSDSSALSYVSPLNSHISGYNVYISIYTIYTLKYIQYTEYSVYIYTYIYILSYIYIYILYLRFGKHAQSTTAPPLRSF